MGLLRTIRDFFIAEAKRSRRGSDFWSKTYDWDRALGYGLPGQGVQPAEGDWRVIIDWAPLQDASIAFDRWRREHQPSAHQLSECVRRETRSGPEAEEMRVLARHDL